MKKLIIALVLVVGISKASAQSFEKGTSVLQLGIGFGGDFGTPFGLGYEYGISDKIGIGAYVGYGSKKDSFFGYDVEYKSVLVGAKGNYHFYQTDKFDAYGGAFLGFNSQSATVSGSTPFTATDDSGVLLGLNAGARYYFTDSLAAFAEVGFGLAIVNVGLAYKL